MPFTFAHPAAVVPIKEKWPKWFDLTALVLGSMAPDFEYFIRFKPQRVVGHSFAGFVYYNLPLVFLAALLWHYVVKKPLILSLPTPIRSYGMSFISHKWKINSIRAFFVFITSALIGMGTHVLWDSFTHANSFFVKAIPLLSRYVNVFGYRIGVYNILQHTSSLVGFWVLYRYLKSKRKNKALPEVYKTKVLAYWAPVVFMGFAAVALRAFYTMKTISLAYIGIYAVTFFSGLFIGMVFVSFIYQAVGIYKGVQG